jgi:hypothetical protein
MDKDFKYSEQILIGREDLVEKEKLNRYLSVRIGELETEHAYQMQKSEQHHTAKVKEVHEGYCAAIEELKEKNEQMETDHMTEMNAVNADIARIKRVHEHALSDLQDSFTEKLLVEYEKYEALQARTNTVSRDYER